MVAFRSLTPAPQQSQLLQALGAQLARGGSNRRGLSNASANIAGAILQAQGIRRQKAEREALTDATRSALAQIAEGGDRTAIAGSLVDVAPRLALQLGLQAPAERKIIQDRFGVSRFQDTGDPVFDQERVQTEAPPQNEKLVEIFDESSPTGTRLVTESEALGQPGRQRGGTSLSVSPEGDVSFTQGFGQQPELSKPSQSRIEKGAIDSANALSRIKDIGEAFDPNFLTIGTKFDALKAGTLEKLGFQISGDDRKLLQEFSTFRRRSINNLNRLLNELSGAAVSPQEAKRIQASQPDAGTGLFDGDSPTEFKAKIDDVTRQLKLAMARFNFARFTGNTNPLSIGLGDVENVIEQEGERIEREILAARPGLEPDLLNAEVKARLSNIFGAF